MVAWDIILASVTMDLMVVSTPDAELRREFVFIREEEIFLSSELVNN